MATYTENIEALSHLCDRHGDNWKGINPEYAARMRAQNRFRTGIEIAQYTSDIMRADMAAYDADSGDYTQSLGCWHGFVAAGDDGDQTPPERHQTSLYLPQWLDGCRPAFPVWPAARPEHA